MEFRRDAEATGKYRDLRLWLQDGISGQSVAHATDIIDQKIDDYSWAIRKHGLSTVPGAVTYLFDWKKSAVMAPTTAAGNGRGWPLVGDNCWRVNVLRPSRWVGY